MAGYISNSSVVYHVFSKSLSIPNKDVCPLLYSIATLRRWSNLPVFVIDKTPQFHDWQHYPKMLDFTVIKDDLERWPNVLFGRIFDLKEHMSDMSERIVFCDSDIFWIDEISLQDDDYFHTSFAPKNGVTWANSGFFYFRRNTCGDDFFQHWCDNLKNWKEKSIDDYTIALNNDRRITDESTLAFTVHHTPNQVKQQHEVLTLMKGCEYVPCRGVHVVSDFCQMKLKFASDIIEINNALREVLSGDPIINNLGSGKSHIKNVTGKTLRKILI